MGVVIPWPQGAFSKEMQDRIANARILAVGAGGIGCELLKTLVLSGFKTIEVVDLDTIEVSNLNRQFLFRKRHVGQSKAAVAAEAVKHFRPDVSITAHQANIKDSKYDIDYFKRFDLVLNGLDNLDARRHVNRMCLAAEVPLVESGTAGYLGQVSVHVGKKTECFDCQPKPTPKSYAVCTIRTSPDKPIHCVVWAKDLLFQALFGPRDEESDLDPKGKLVRREDESAEEFAKRVFNVVFDDAIQEVLNTADEEVWRGRTPPKALKLMDLDLGLSDEKDKNEGKRRSADNGNEVRSACTALGLTDQNAVWTPQESAAVFIECIRRMFDQRSSEIGSLSFDKDDDLAVEFVAAATNLRCLCYHIPHQSLFDTKGMAGNIIHAIATTNAIISGFIVMEAMKLLAGQGDPVHCRSTYLRQDLSNKKVIVPAKLQPPNSKCVVCGHARLQLRIDTTNTLLSDLVTKVLRGHLGLVEPTLMFGNSNSMFNYEEGEDLDPDEVEENAVHLKKTLADLPAGGIVHNRVLEIIDQKQQIKLEMVVLHQEEWDEEVYPHKFAVEGEVPAAKIDEVRHGDTVENDHADQSLPKKRLISSVEEDENGVILLDESEGEVIAIVGGGGVKRKKTGENGETAATKKARVEEVNNGGDNEDVDVIEMLD